MSHAVGGRGPTFILQDLCTLRAAYWEPHFCLSSLGTFIVRGILDSTGSTGLSCGEPGHAGEFMFLRTSPQSKIDGNLVDKQLSFLIPQDTLRPILHSFPEFHNGDEFQLPTRITYFIMHLLLTSFLFWSHFFSSGQ